MTEEQRYLFDAFGYLIVPDAVTQAQIEELRATLRMPAEQREPAGRHAGPLHWSRAWRDLLDLPALSPILEELVGNHERPVDGDPSLPTFRIDHVNVHTHVRQGFPGGMLHGGWKTAGGSQFFRYHDGRFFNGLVAVAFELHDTHVNGGGFCCIPGTHKANLPLPEQWQDLSKGIYPSVQRVPARPGDAIVFTEALTHGTLPWTADTERRTLFYKFSPHGTSWSGAYFDPDDFRHYPDMDDRKMAILEPPNARYATRPTRPEPLARNGNHS